MMPSRIEADQLLLELPPLALDVGAVAFVGPERLLLAGDLEFAQRPPDGHATTAELLGQFVQEGVGLVVDELPQALPSGLVERR